MNAVRDTLTAVLRNEAIDWSRVSHPSQQRDLKEAARHESVVCLLGHHVQQRSAGVPPALRAELAQLARAEALKERCAQLEVVRVLDILGNASIPVLLMKGTALAYTHYSHPWLRQRSDLDLLVRHSDVECAARLLTDAGYDGPRPLPGTTFCQEMHLSRQAKAVRHVIDLHWKTSKRPIFARALPVDQVFEASIPVERLGGHARTLKPVHALLLACMHRVGHYNSETLAWLYDLHLLAERLSHVEAQDFVDIARDRQVWAVCARSIELARAHFHTSLPGRLRAALESGPGERLSEPSASYLTSRPWRARTMDLRALPTWRQRAQGLRELAFPSRAYMRELYDGRRSVPLPLLYLDRLGRGAVKMVRRQTQPT